MFNFSGCTTQTPSCLAMLSVSLDLLNPSDLFPIQRKLFLLPFAASEGTLAIPSGFRPHGCTSSVSVDTAKSQEELYNPCKLVFCGL